MKVLAQRLASGRAISATRTELETVVTPFALRRTKPLRHERGGRIWSSEEWLATESIEF